MLTSGLTVIAAMAGMFLTGLARSSAWRGHHPRGRCRHPRVADGPAGDDRAPRRPRRAGAHPVAAVPAQAAHRGPSRVWTASSPRARATRVTRPRGLRPPHPARRPGPPPADLVTRRTTCPRSLADRQDLPPDPARLPSEPEPAQVVVSADNVDCPRSLPQIGSAQAAGDRHRSDAPSRSPSTSTGPRVAVRHHPARRRRPEPGLATRPGDPPPHIVPTHVGASGP